MDRVAVKTTEKVPYGWEGLLQIQRFLTLFELYAVIIA